MLHHLVLDVAQLTAAQASGPQNGFSMILMIVVMLAIMYFLLLRPQQKQQKRHQEFLAQLKKGDEVVLQAGILGKVYAVEEKMVVLEIADKVRVKVLRNAVVGDAPRPGEPDKGEKSDKSDKKDDADKSEKK